ncbi:DUF2336 domain-containing protein [Methylobacterium terricola]|uniref:DUF2336 domain-containing protein n=1 Tax=Methylobacterium terricola TaxID=2583531 RepID=A0A5C4LNV8_9HYPH|nr:DUF2336 domain-containing protein [Methylobacterium terricola]TNC15930.1 DUF2336 domain-containing protein [Methylobacterium terricola]
MASAAASRPEGRRASGAPSLADLVDEAERVAPGEEAARALHDVADLLIAGAERLSGPQVSAFDEVMTVLAEGAGTDSRGRLARRVGGLARPPHKLARRLADDPEASVAVPVLAACASLPDEVLLRVARRRGPVHLAAIAGRDRVAARVADVLADRGDQAVMATLLGNPGAQLSLAALSALSERMEDRHGLAAGLAARGVLPGQRKALLRGPGPSGPPRRAAEAVALRIRLGLDEADLRNWLANGRVTEAVLGLAHLAGCSAARAEAAHRAPGAKALALIVRAADLRLSTLGAFLRARPGPAPTPEAAGRAVALYRGATVAGARATVAGWPR